MQLENNSALPKIKKGLVFIDGLPNLIPAVVHLRKNFLEDPPKSVVVTATFKPCMNLRL